MKRKRRYLISAAVFAACVCIPLGVLAMLPGSRITKANFDRVEKGMTVAEVEAIFGEPWRISPSFKMYPQVRERTYMWFRKDGAGASVLFLDGVVDETLPWNESNETLTDTLRRWLRLSDDED